LTPEQKANIVRLLFSKEGVMIRILAADLLEVAALSTLLALIACLAHA
jgi:hypothetical protein